MYITKAGELDAFPWSDKSDRGLEQLLVDGVTSLALRPLRDEAPSCAWLKRLADGSTESGYGSLSDHTSPGAVSLADCAAIAALSDRSAYIRLERELGEAGWAGELKRHTFDRDCRELNAEGLHEEDEWCKNAYTKIGAVPEPMGCLVAVYGTPLYFCRWNFKWEDDDAAELKSSHDFDRWVFTYIPTMRERKGVERYVFLEADVHEQFASHFALRDMAKAFTLLHFPFQR